MRDLKNAIELDIEKTKMMIGELNKRLDRLTEIHCLITLQENPEFREYIMQGIEDIINGGKK